VVTPLASVSLSAPSMVHDDSADEDDDDSDDEDDDEVKTISLESGVSIF